MCGFISGNITRGAKLAACVTPNWKAYSKTAYVQSCALLEGLCKETAQLIDTPFYESQVAVDEHVIPEIQKQWAQANTVARYLYLSDALQLMYDQGLLKKKLPAKFFRYHNYHLWDRHICCAAHVWLSEKNIWFDEWTLYTKKLTSFLADEKMAAKIIEDVNATLRLVLMKSAIEENAKIVEASIQEMYNEHNKEQYPMNIVENDKAASSNVTNMFKAA
jgi:hypothetical protein